MVAGRNAIKLLTIDDSRFIDIKLEHRFNAFQISLMDACWSHVDDSLLVSCASDGGLQKWKQTEHSFTLDSLLSIHNRTVNKINLHPSEAHYLLSGDQDGYIYLSDFRIKNNPSKTFRHDQNDIVTDIKFNPSNSYQFASASDSGCFFV
jgi:WD repeat-containing protein 24